MRTIKLYTYDELTETAKDNAIKNYRKKLVYCQVFWECINEDIEESFAYTIKDSFPGIYIKDIRFSLNYCQGDGVSFVGSIDDVKGIKALAEKVYNGNVPKNIKRIIPFLYEIQFDIVDYHYCHAYTIDTTVIDNYNDCNHDRFLRTCQQFEKDINSYRIDICKEMEQTGYTIQAEQQSGENIENYIKHSRIEFFDDGKIAI